MPPSAPHKHVVSDPTDATGLVQAAGASRSEASGRDSETPPQTLWLTPRAAGSWESCSHPLAAT